MIGKLQNFMDKSDTNRYLVIGIIVLILGTMFYVTIFNKKSKTIEQKGNVGDINVTTKDTVFNKIHNGYEKNNYYTEQKKTIDDSDNFYSIKEDIEELKGSIEKDSTENGDVRDINLIKKAIIEQHKEAGTGNVTRKKTMYTRAKVNYSSRKSTREINTSSNDWKENLKDDTNDFFYSETANKNHNITNTGSSELKTDSKIYAVISGAQTVKNGSRIRMRLANDCVVNGIKHSRNSIVYGFVSFSTNRVHIQIKDINNTPVALDVYDAQDYDRGLHTELTFNSEVKQEVREEAIDEVNVSGIPVVGTIKNLVKRKLRTEKIELDNNTRLTFKPS